MNVREAEKLYRNSIKVLKEVQLSNGGCLATPKGERYPYVYPRDHAFCIMGFLSAGMVNEAKKGLEFVFKGQMDNGAFPQRYDTNGKDASYKPIQIGGTGLILYAFTKYVNQTRDYEFAKKNWKKVRKAVSYIIGSIYEDKYLIFTPNSLHEFPPSEEGLEIWSNCSCIAALRDLSRLAIRIGLDHSKWEEQRCRITGNMLKYMWNSRIKSFIKNIRVRESSSLKLEPDIAEYGVAYFGILPDSDKRIISTVKRIEKDLWNEDLGGICRYPKREGRHNGGFGPWPHYTLMLCRHYINTRNNKMADKYMKWVVDVAYDYYLPEHISTRKEFQQYVDDFGEAGILRKDRMIMIENARKHPMFKKGIAYVTPILSWPHAEFIMTWNMYKKKFLKSTER